MSDFNLTTVAVIRSCYKQKFGIPRQSGLCKSSEAIIEFVPPYNHEDYVRELEDFSHLWVVFIFHRHLNKDVKATVRPPRLGGNKRIGVFASRSSFRPNPVGLSVVKLNKITNNNGKIELLVSGADLLDGTPVLDIKPYIKYADAVTDAYSSYADTRPEDDTLSVEFSDQSLSMLDSYIDKYPKLKSIITETLSLDPRPAYQNDNEREYGLTLFDLNIKWIVTDNSARVILIEPL